MNTLKAVIVDDEASSIESLAAKIEMFTPQVKVVKTFILSQEALREIPKLDVDLIFLDIEMPHLDGLSFAEKAKLGGTEIIYTTAYQKYAKDAFKVCAFDFLLKPVDRHELVKSMNRLLAKLSASSTASANRFTLLYHKITIPSTRGLLFIEIQDIVWLESDNNYTTLHMADSGSIVTSRSIGDFETLLASYNFCRIHQSAIINLQYLKEYLRGEGGTVILTNGKELEVSRRRKAYFLSMVQ